jgi:hypothetical protein
MPTTVEEISEFQRFAVEQVRNGGSDLSLEELLERWRAQRSKTNDSLRNKVNAAIRRGIAEADAGLGRPLDEFMDEFRQRHNIASDT